MLEVLVDGGSFPEFMGADVVVKEGKPVRVFLRSAILLSVGLMPAAIFAQLAAPVGNGQGSAIFVWPGPIPSTAFQLDEKARNEPHISKLVPKMDPPPRPGPDIHVPDKPTVIINMPERPANPTLKADMKREPTRDSSRPPFPKPDQITG